MKNYINICGQQIELTAEQVEQLKSSFILNKIKLADIAVGECFKIGTHEFVVLEHSGDTTAVVLKNLLEKKKEFGSTNNYSESNVDKICQKFGAEIAGLVGEDNLVEHTVDLTANDGLKDYGKVRRRISLVTADLYRRYVDILDEHKIDSWWWLATPFSTQKHGYTSAVLCVAPAGRLLCGIFSGINGVRPFCILKSHIFVSK